VALEEVAGSIPVGHLLTFRIGKPKNAEVEHTPALVLAFKRGFR
jgi:hypothetical protein